MASQDPQRLEYAAKAVAWAGASARPADLMRAREPVERIILNGAIGVAWRVVLGGLLVAFVLVLWHGVSPAVAVVAPIVLVILLPAAAAMMRQVRRRRALVVLTYLEQAIRLNLPLPRMLDAAQRSESGAVARRLMRLASLLDAGAPIGGALAVSLPETPRRVLSRVASAERLGRVPTALSRVVEEERFDVDCDPERQSFGRWYPMLMALGVGSLVLMILTFVVPKFEDLFLDFGLKLPDTTVALVGIARLLWSSEVLSVLLMILVAGVTLNVLGGAFRSIFDPGSRDVALAAARGAAGAKGPFDWRDRVVWHVPVAHAVVRDRGLGDACRTIADALRSGRTLNRAIEEASLLGINAVLRGRLRNWRTRVEAGIPADQAAREARLPELVAGMIGPAGAGGQGITDAFEFLADYYGSRFSRSRELLRAAIVPLMVLCFAAIVLFVIAALFMPLVELMDHLNQTVLGVD